MDQLIPSLATLVESFRDCFHPQVFQTFQTLIAGWIICLGPRTLSEVWQATGLAAKRHHDTAYAVFHSAAWEWDDLGIVLATLILTHLIPGGVVWIVVDDTLCHKRGAKVAFGGIFLDAVLSSKRHKTLRFGLNWVVLGIADVNAAVLQDRPKNLQVIGPLHWKAALYGLPAPRRPGQKGAWRKKGDRLPNPKAMIEDTATYPAEVLEITFPKQTRQLRVQVIRDVLWDRGSKTGPVMVVLVRDPLGRWRDEALVATDPTASAPFVILGYCRRWSVELAFFDSKQYLGLHDPRVWAERSVERAHPMAWFIGSLTILWYCIKGHEGSHVVKDRPWYTAKVTPTFTDMLGALRLQMWEYEVFGESDEEPPSPECIRNLLHKLAAVA